MPNVNSYRLRARKYSTEGAGPTSPNVRVDFVDSRCPDVKSSLIIRGSKVSEAHMLSQSEAHMLNQSCSSLGESHTVPVPNRKM